MRHALLLVALSAPVLAQTWMFPYGQVAPNVSPLPNLPPELPNPAFNGGNLWIGWEPGDQQWETSGCACPPRLRFEIQVTGSIALPCNDFTQLRFYILDAPNPVPQTTLWGDWFGGQVLCEFWGAPHPNPGVLPDSAEAWIGPVENFQVPYGLTVQAYVVPFCGGVALTAFLTAPVTI